MRHVSIQQLSAFVDGALTGVSRDLVTRHLAACADCRERHALWHIYDEVLKRVLSWEPNERTLEEASARVELILTAERRGMPVPEFTSVLPPVIASGPDTSTFARASGSFATLPPNGGQPFAPTTAMPAMVAEPVYASGEMGPARVRRKGKLGPVLAACAALALLALVSLPFLPDVIRIPLPGDWQPRVPHVEFAQREQPAPPAAPREPQVKLAEREPVEGVLVRPPQTLPAALPATVESVAAKPELAKPQAETLAAPARAQKPASAAVKQPAAKQKPAAIEPRAEKPAHAPKEQPAQHPAPPPPDEHVTYGEDHPVTIVPVQVKTEVNLSPTSPAKPTSPAADSEAASDESLPLLCGVVVDEAGAPVEGARVTLASPSLTVRTDRRGHFCVACAAGERSVTVEMTGYAPATRTVTLTGSMVETRITLALAP